MIEALGNLGDFIGGVGIVVTLVYLAIQIRRNIEQTRSDTAGTTWSGILDASDPVYCGEKTDFFQRGLTLSSNLSLTEGLTFGLLMTRVFGQFELSLYEARRGALDEALLAMHSRSLQSIVIPPGGRDYRERSGRSLLGLEFVEYVNGILANPDPRVRGAEERPPR